jgi:hypothetical protein
MDTANGQAGQHRPGEALAALDAALDQLASSPLALLDDRAQLDLLLAAQRAGARLHAWTARLAARIEIGGAAWEAHRTSATTWLAEAGNLTPREARRLIRAGQSLDRFQTIGVAAAAGGVLPGQAEAITSVLDDLPHDLPTVDLDQAQELMVEFAGSYNAAELRRLSSRLLEVLAPDTADQLEADRVERDHRRALRHRYLDFTGDGHGSILLRGSLPVAEAEPFIRIIDSYAAAQKRAALEAADPQAEQVTPAMRRADALLAMVDHHSRQALAPVNGGARPRIVLTLNWDTLHQQYEHAHRTSRDGGGNGCSGNAGGSGGIGRVAGHRVRVTGGNGYGDHSSSGDNGPGYGERGSGDIGHVDGPRVRVTGGNGYSDHSSGGDNGPGYGERGSGDSSSREGGSGGGVAGTTGTGGGGRRLSDAGNPCSGPVGSGATMISTEDPVPAGLVRQWLCDADLLPAVLGGPSETLDVGHTQRLVTPAIRAALELRDRGCVFPGCNVPPQGCHAHHIIPWWAGGPTALWNLVLLCPHHHGILEPSHDPDDDRWTVQLRDDGIPEIRPPRRADPQQKPRTHARFQLSRPRPRE